MREFTADADGVSLAVRDYGGSGQGLLLLHGGGGNLATWDELGPRLARDFHVVAYDAIGHGQSARLPKLPAATIMADHIDAVAHAAGLSDPVLVGHSLGGATALRRAARGGGIKGVVTVDGAITAAGDHHYPTTVDLEAYRQEIRERGWGWTGSPDALEERLQEVGREERLTTRRGAVLVSGLLEQRPMLDDIVTMYALGQQLRDTVAIYDRIDCPVLLLCAERYERPPAASAAESKELLAEVAARRPNVQVEWFDAGHLLHWELPDVVEARICEFAHRIS